MPLNVPTRRISFEESLADLPKHFADGDLVLSHLAVAMSSVFPEGEDYFVRSVRHFRDQITDPELAEAVRGFIGQESIHGREHRAFNERLAELGYPTRFVDRVTGRMLRLRERVLPPIANLAATAALEHFTATLAELMLTDEEARAMLGHPVAWELFMWHALEEAEHKAVAFDVYRAVGGTERMRIWTMRMLRWGFTLGTATQMVASLSMDRATYEGDNLRRGLRRLRSSPLISRRTWLRLKDYERPGFHPHDHDTDALVEEWRIRLFGDNGRLVGRLVGAGTAAAHPA